MVLPNSARLSKSDGLLHGFQSWQMFEARLILESNLAALAAERGTEEHYTALAEEVAEIFAFVDNPLISSFTMYSSTDRRAGFGQSDSGGADGDRNVFHV